MLAAAVGFKGNFLVIIRIVEVQDIAVDTIPNLTW